MSARVKFGVRDRDFCHSSFSEFFNKIDPKPTFQGGVTPPVFIRRSGTDRKGYLPKARSAIALSIAALTADMLKLAPPCIGGNSIKVCAAFATSC